MKFKQKLKELKVGDIVLHNQLSREELSKIFTEVKPPEGYRYGKTKFSLGNNNYMCVTLVRETTNGCAIL